MSTLIEDCKNIIKRLGLAEKLDGNTVKIAKGCNCSKPNYTFNEVKQQLICSCGKRFNLQPE